MLQPSLLKAKINHSPEKFAQILQEKGDVFWWEPANFWVVTRYDYAEKILTNADFSCDRAPFFITRMPNIDLNLVQDFFSVVSKMMVMSDAPEHVARRRVCYEGFNNRALLSLESNIESIVDKCISRCLDKGRIELVEEMAKIIPSTILADFFAIPETERNAFYQWSNNMTQFFGGASQYRNEDGIEVNHSASQLRDYFIQLIAARRKKPQNDFLSILLKNQQAFALNDEEIVSQAIMMLVAGQVTTTDQLCNNVYTLMSTPGLLQQFNTLNHLDRGIDELSRLDPAVTFIFRVAKCDTLIGNQPIKAGEVIFISTHSVNRDVRFFQKPNQCLPGRANPQHLSYGYGAHFCIGAKLARLEMNYCIKQLLKCLPNLRLDPDDAPIRKHHSLAFSGFERLPLCFN